MKLQPFSNSTGSEIPFELTATQQWQGDILIAEYWVRGPFQRIKNLGPANDRSRKNNLWQTTCFEWFLKPVSVAEEPMAPYWEANFAAGGSWNIYKLTGYRQNLTEESLIQPEQIESSRRQQGLGQRQDDEWHMRTAVDFSKLNWPVKSQFSASLNAVLEHDDHSKTYWALTHLQKQADFHHPDHFILPLLKER
jgi:hypothetical protein